MCEYKYRRMWRLSIKTDDVPRANRNSSSSSSSGKLALLTDRHQLRCCGRYVDGPVSAVNPVTR